MKPNGQPWPRKVCNKRPVITRVEETLYHYLWLAANTPNSHADRIAQLKAEALRRGRQDIIARAQDLATRQRSHGRQCTPRRERIAEAK